jgi:hypothetical protein
MINIHILASTVSKKGHSFRKKAIVQESFHVFLYRHYSTETRVHETNGPRCVRVVVILGVFSLKYKTAHHFPIITLFLGQNI